MAQNQIIKPKTLPVQNQEKKEEKTNISDTLKRPYMMCCTFQLNLTKKQL